MKYQKRMWGITLLELMILILISASLASLSVPGFTFMKEKFRMNNSVNNLVHALHLARQKSRLNGTVISLCKSLTGDQCNNDAEWHDGWLVFGNTDADDPPVVDAGEPVYVSTLQSGTIRISANRQAFHIRPFGRRSTNGTFRYCSSRKSVQHQAVIISYTGKPRTQLSDSREVCEAV
ncbi:MAG: GspH/FimT family protein [Gammaproteobacteria bacterium]